MSETRTSEEDRKVMASAGPAANRGGGRWGAIGVPTEQSADFRATLRASCSPGMRISEKPGRRALDRTISAKSSIRRRNSAMGMNHSMSMAVRVWLTSHFSGSE